MKSPEVLLNGFVPHAPENTISGRIISAYAGAAELGPNSIVTINRGHRDGIEEGNVLAIYEFGITLAPAKNAPTPKKETYINLERDADGSIRRDAEGRVQVRVGSRTTGAAVKGVKLPDERIGLMMVFRVFERVSYALVLQVERPVHVLDVVTTP